MEGVALVDEWLEGREGLLARRVWWMRKKDVRGGDGWEAGAKWRGRSTMSRVHVV